MVIVTFKYDWVIDRRGVCIASPQLPRGSYTAEGLALQSRAAAGLAAVESDAGAAKRLILESR